MCKMSGIDEMPKRVKDKLQGEVVVETTWGPASDYYRSSAEMNRDLRAMALMEEDDTAFMEGCLKWCVLPVIFTAVVGGLALLGTIIFGVLFG